MVKEVDECRLICFHATLGIPGVPNDQDLVFQSQSSYLQSSELLPPSESGVAK